MSPTSRAAAGRSGTSSTAGSACAAAAAGRRRSRTWRLASTSSGGSTRRSTGRVSPSVTPPAGSSPSGRAASGGAPAPGHASGSPARSRRRASSTCARPTASGSRAAPSSPARRPARQVPERYDVASPIEHLPIGVPTLLVHGTADDVVPHAFSRAYAKRAAEAQELCELVSLPGVGHMEHLDPESPAWAPVTTWLEGDDRRATPSVSTPRTRWRAFASASRSRTRGRSISTETRSAGRPRQPVSDERAGRPLGQRPRPRLARLDRAAGTRGRPARHRRARRAARRGDRCDSTTVNLYKLASAVIANRPGAIVADAGDFPTNRYVLAGLARAQGECGSCSPGTASAGGYGRRRRRARQPLARGLPQRRARGHGARSRPPPRRR